MAHSRKPSVWVDPRRATSGYVTYRVQFERDGERFPGLACGPGAALARKIEAQLKLKLWERDAVLEKLLAELRAKRLERDTFAADLLAYLTDGTLPGILRTAAEQVTVGQWRREYLHVCREQNRPGAVANFDEPAVNGFADFVGDATLLQSVTQEEVRRWKAHLFARGGTDRKKRPMPLGNTTVRMRLAHAGAGFAWAVKREWLKRNPFDAVERPKTTKHERVLTGDELRLIYTEILPPPHHLWFTTLLWTGLRREELVSLSRPQVLRSLNVDELWRLKFAAEQTKNGRAKVVELHPEAQAAVAAALAISPGEQLFEGLTLSKVQHWFEQIEARLGGRVTPHTMKHTFCTRFMEATGDLDSLVLMTGNSRRSLEAHYLHLSRSRPKAVLRVAFGFSPPALPQNAYGSGAGVDRWWKERATI